VLISPHAIANLDQTGKVLRVNLTRKQIEDSPAIESHKPVSRQYEEEYFRYFGWPYYWQGGGVWGMSGFPILELPLNPLPGEPAAPIGPQSERADAHLRNTQAVNGYHLQATDGIIGHVCDFMMDDKKLGDPRTGHQNRPPASGKEVLIPTSKVDRISFDDSTVFVNMTREAVEQNPEYHLVPVGVAD